MKLATIFHLTQESVYLLVDNKAIFPGQSGRFSRDQIDFNCTYQVVGDEKITTSARDALPFGSFTSGSLRKSFPYSQAQPHPPLFRQKKAFLKNILLVTLQEPIAGDKPSSSKTLLYTIITQTQVSIDNSCCSPSAVAQLVTASIGYDVILLDSKCYPLLDNDATSTLEFWKSTRKILAASKVSYNKLTNKPVTNIDLTGNDEPLPKRQCSDDSDLLKEVLDRTKKLEKGFDFLSSLAQTFECLICKGICKKPIIAANCCQRIVGCDTCVSRWSETSDFCPHCSTSGFQCLQLKGMDNTLVFASCIFDPGSDNITTNRQHETAYDSDSSGELPPVSFSRHN